MLQEEIMRFGDFFKGIERFNDALIVKVVFPSRWQVFSSKDERIKPAKGNDVDGEYYYYGDTNNVSLDEIFGLIDDTVKINREIEEKVSLLVEYRKKLEQLFEENNIDTLKRLEFTFTEDSKAPKKKRKYTKRKKAEAEVENEPSNVEETPQEMPQEGDLKAEEGVE